MGSYCSILNNTQDVWCVKLGSDEAAIHISSVTFLAAGIAASAIATAGATAPLMTSLAANGVTEILGVSTATLMAGTTAVAGIPIAGVAGASTVGGVVTSIVQSRLTTDGFDLLLPGEKKRYGKMSLSLWQQGTCIRTRENLVKKQILVEKLYMRPVFSGPTDDSENVHEIQYWLDKWGVEHVSTIQLKD